MKGHKAHHHRREKAEGGAMSDDQKSGSKEFDADLKSKPVRYTGGKPEDEAEERKRGGRAKRKAGGVVHHERMSLMKHAKHVGKVAGEEGKSHAGRKPRKAGGRASADSNPFSSARRGAAPAGHRVEMED